jgi:hypothetical protein
LSNASKIAAMALVCGSSVDKKKKKKELERLRREE